MKITTVLYKKLKDGIVIRYRQDFEHGEVEMKSHTLGFKPDQPCILYFYRGGFDTKAPIKGATKFAVKYNGEDLSKRTFLPFV